MKSFSWPFVTTVLALAGVLTASRLSDHRQPQPLARPLDIIEKQIDGWTSTGDRTIDPEILAILKPTSYLSRNYRRNGRQVGLFISHYAMQRAGESMHSPKNCLPGSGWEIVESGSAHLSIHGRPVKVNKYAIQSGKDRMLVVYWYQSKGRIIAGEYWGKLCLVRDAILDGRTSGSMVRLLMADEPGALEDAQAFASHLIPRLQDCFGG